MIGGFSPPWRMGPADLGDRSAKINPASPHGRPIRPWPPATSKERAASAHLQVNCVGALREGAFDPVNLLPGGGRAGGSRHPPSEWRRERRWVSALV